MRLFYKSTIFITLLACLSFLANAQEARVVNIPGTATVPTDIYPIIMGDTTETGERTNNNTVYTLDNGALYFVSDRLVNKPEWKLHIQATDLNNTDSKPIILRIPDDQGGRPKIAYPEGDMTLKNLWLITGDKGPGEQHDWGQIRLLGENSRIVVEDCIIEKDRGGFLQLRANGVKLFVNNCVFRNGGNRFILQGNGRGIDSRNFAFDSLVVKNTVMHNIIDRVFRSIGNTIPHNYIEFDRNTIFNVAGRHGCFNFEWVNHAKVTNNLLINPMMLGTTPAFTDEQNQPDNGSHKIFTTDTITAETQFTISNNNIFWTQDVIDVWAKHDTVNRPAIYSDLVKQVMGADTANSYIEEVISLNSVPMNITQYVDDLYANPAATDMFDFVVEDIAVQGTALDFGNLFDFATFDPCYDSNTQSATAATDFGGLGYRLGCGLEPAPARVVCIEDNGDPFVPVDIYPFIMGDTTATGERVNNNTIYCLENGAVYITSDRLVNKPSWPLQIQAKDLSNTALKAIITRVPDDQGGRPKIAYPEGDMTLKNLWLITGEKGPDEQHDWGQIRLLGENSRIVVEDCIIEKDRGGFLQLRANGVKLFVNNCVFRNGGNRFILQGNGRGIDSRNFAFDSLVVKNTIIHNVIDRVFRSIGNTIPHNYIEFDRNTIFNIAGRHGCFNFEWVNEAKVTNNLLINPMMLGTTPAFTDEQNQPDNESHKIFSTDTITAETKFTISNNNIFWTQDVIDVWAKHDTVNRPAIYSDLVKEVMGADTADSYIEEVISLNSVPMNITQYIDDLYANPAATDMFDFVVEDEIVAGTPLDNGNLFDFATFDPCYDPNSESATAATNGGPLGYTLGCEGFTTDIETEIEHKLTFTVAPNPFTGSATLTYGLTKSGSVNIVIFDLSGRVVGKLVNDYQPAGEHKVIWNPETRVKPGLYIARLETEEGTATKKIMKH